MARGNDGQKIFLGESDYQAFIEALRTVRQRYPFFLYAYVLMPNHFHLLLEVHRFPTARILQSLLTGYARRFNKIHRRRGHLFEGRYKAIVCDRDSYLLELVRFSIRSAIKKRVGSVFLMAGGVDEPSRASRSTNWRNLSGNYRLA